jgi:hypothetical protein
VEEKEESERTEKLEICTERQKGKVIHALN